MRHIVPVALTPAGQTLLAAGAAGGRALVESCTRDRADVWALLWKAVTRMGATKTRTDSGDSSD